MSENEQVETLDGGELVYRASQPEAMLFREEGDGGLMLSGRMMPYGEWAEVRSSVEGHFMERFELGSLAKTLKERATRIRALFEHGMDFLGRQPIATIDAFRDEDDGAYYDASLLRGLPDLLVEGLRRGVYGSSIRFRPIKWDRVRSPAQSEHNPDGIPEHTIREAFVQEFSVVTFPQYEGATASVRSLTDEVAARQLLRDPERLIEIIRSTSEPQHSGREEPVAEAELADPAEPSEVTDPERSRSTQPVRDYLKPRGGDKKWL